MRPVWTSYIAIGDSFTEGLDDWRDDGLPRGWADRLAERLAEDTPHLRYANLAVRGKLLDQIVADQLPAAEALRPDLVSFCAGGNDIIRPRCSLESLARRLDDATARLVATGADVVMFTGFDTRKVPVLNTVRGRIGSFNHVLREIADRHGCLLVDLWAMEPLAEPSSWGRDRLHLTPDGHRRVALGVCEALGLTVSEDWREAGPVVSHPWLRRRRADLDWSRNYLLPFVRDWLRGRQTGEGFAPKRPELTRLLETSQR